MDILNLLIPYIDEKYKNFHKKICNTKYKILGVKIPTLRKIAKKLLKEYDYKKILNNIGNIYYEEVMLEGIIIGNIKCDYNKKLDLITNFLPKIDNWAVCDIFCGELKFIKKYKCEFLKYITKINCDKEYYQRFIIVILLDYYIDDNYIDFVLNCMLDFISDKYYVKMAVAWCLSICLIKFFNKTVSFLNDNKYNLDKWTYNKALQKGLESFRISKENKEILKTMKN